MGLLWRNILLSHSFPDLKSGCTRMFPFRWPDKTERGTVDECQSCILQNQGGFVLLPEEECHGQSGRNVTWNLETLLSL